MPTRFGIRALRNHTKDVLDRAALEGEVIITNDGVDVAVIRPLATEWSRLIDRLTNDEAQFDTGWARELQADDESSMEDL